MEGEGLRGFDVIAGDEARQRALRNPALLLLVESISADGNRAGVMGSHVVIPLR